MLNAYLCFIISKFTKVSFKKFYMLKKFAHTHGDKNLHTLLVKHFNDLLNGQTCERSIDKVTYFYVEELFCIHLGTKYADFQEKIFADISGRKFQTLYCSSLQSIILLKAIG